MRIIVAFIIFACMPCLNAAKLNDLEDENKRNLANRLLFFLDSSDLIYSPKRLAEVLKSEGTASKQVFERILSWKNEADRIDLNLNKQKKSTPDQIIFSAYDIRRAAQEILYELGEPVIDVLVKAVNSAKGNIVRGVLEVLTLYKKESLLRTYSEVIIRNTQGKSRFDTYARKVVAKELFDYLEYDRGRDLFRNSIHDKDAEVRLAAFNVIPKEVKKHREFLKKELKLELEEELARVKSYEKRIKIFDKNKTLKNEYYNNLSWYFQVILRSLPEIVMEVDIPKEIYQNEILKSVFLNHHDRLDPKIRSSLLKSSLGVDSTDLFRLAALNAMQASDKNEFQEQIGMMLRANRDPDILVKALILVQEWKLNVYKAKVDLISENDRRSKVRSLAQQVSESF